MKSLCATSRKVRGKSVAVGLRANAFQERCIDVFVRAASAFSLPRSIGQVYGALFSVSRPMNLDELMAFLKTSRGGTHDAIRWLLHVGAVERVKLPGVRKEHYTAELNLRKLAAGYLQLKVKPHIENGEEHLEGLKACIAGTGEEREFQKTRLHKLKSWHGVLVDLLPLLEMRGGGGGAES